MQRDSYRPPVRYEAWWFGRRPLDRHGWRKSVFVSDFQTLERFLRNVVFWFFLPGLASCIATPAMPMQTRTLLALSRSRSQPSHWRALLASLQFHSLRGIPSAHSYLRERHHPTFQGAARAMI